MKRPLAERGDRLDIVFAIRRLDIETGRFDSPGLEYYQSLPENFRRKFGVIFKMLAAKGQVFNKEKFKKLDEHYCEFKAKPHRLICRFTEGQLVIVTHGFCKKKDKTDREEFDRADEIFEADQRLAATGLLVSDRTKGR